MGTKGKEKIWESLKTVGWTERGWNWERNKE